MTLRAGGLSLGTATEHFLTAKAAEGASPKTLEWYRMVLGRLGRDLGAHRAMDSLTPTEVRAWLLTLRETLSPISVAGYVRGLKAFGAWCAAEQLAEARALRTLRRPQVPYKLLEPLADEALRRLLDAASVRDRAIVLLMLDTGLRLSEVAGLRHSDLRPDGSVKVLGKGSRERVVPVGAAARQAPPAVGRSLQVGLQSGGSQPMARSPVACDAPARRAVEDRSENLPSLQVHPTYLRARCRALAGPQWRASWAALTQGQTAAA